MQRVHGLQDSATRVASSRNADLPSGLRGSSSLGAEASEEALRQQVAVDRKRLDELVESLTPALAPVLEPRIIRLRQRIADGEAEQDERRQRRMTEAGARELVARVIENVDGVRDLLRKGTQLERRDVLRGVIEELAFDPDEDTGELVLRAVPALPGNEESRELLALGSSRTMAGAAHSRRETPPGHGLLRVFRIGSVAA